MKRYTSPIALVQAADGTFYGATSLGGTKNGGTLFKMPAGGMLTTLHSFNGADGLNPTGLLPAADGNLYGTTSLGGTLNNGTIFEITPGGTLTTLVSFYGTDASKPNGLIQSNGTFYGTTLYGGAGVGTVFSLALSTTLPAPTVTLSPMSIVFGSQTVGTVSSLQTLTLTNSGTAALNITSIGVGGTDGSDFYDTPNCGSSVAAGASCTISVTFKPTAVGTRTAVVTITDNAGNSPQTVSLTGTGQGAPTGQNAPTISNNGIVNGAGSPLPPAPVAPGSIVTIYGSNFAPGASHNGVSAPPPPLPKTLNSAQVLMNGVAAPLIYVDSFQINAQVPWEVSGASSLNVQVVSNGVQSNVATVALASAAPGISVVTHAADGSPVTAAKPAVPGEYLTIYCTGLGPVTNQPPSGAPALSSPLSSTKLATTVMFGGIPVMALSALTPGFAGLYQVNVQVPANFAGGSSVSVVIQAGGVLSNTSVISVNAPASSAQFTLTITKAGTGSGTVNANPSGSTYVAGTVVTLTATANVGSTFAGWSGACTGSGPCAVAMDANKTVTATFSLSPSGGPPGGSGWVVTILASFDATTGAPLLGPLVQGADGNLYGTTSGYNNGTLGFTGITGPPTGGGATSSNGAIFRITPGGTLTTLYSFKGIDGFAPFAGLVKGTDGNFYGTTIGGGPAYTGISGNRGYGTIFKITPGGALTTLYTFRGTDGCLPISLVQGLDGNFYGITASGGSTACYLDSGTGTFFKITPTGALTTLRTFISSDESNPISLVQGMDGNFYGTGSNANGNGTIFQLTPGGTLATLYTFNSSDGSFGLVQGKDGNFYGTTVNNGTVFRITPGGVLTTLYSSATGSLGALIQGMDGNFYGTTTGIDNNNVAHGGTIFEFTPGGNLTTLHTFNGADGSAPTGALFQAADGSFYGTTLLGGANGDGTVFHLTPPSAAPNILYSSSQFITAALGGNIKLPDGSNVTIAPGALAADQTVTLQLVAALPWQPPSGGDVIGVGPALLLSASSPPFGTSTGDIQFVISASSTTNGLQGSAALADLIDGGGDNFVGVQGSFDSAKSAATISVPAALMGGVNTMVVSMANLAPSTASQSDAASRRTRTITANAMPPSPGQLSWNGSSWGPYSGCRAGAKVLVLVHGMKSSVEGAFVDANGNSCVNAIQSAGAIGGPYYNQVVGFDYDWTNDIAQNGKSVAAFLDTLAACQNIQQIDVEAHSEGGPVSAYGITQAQPATQSLIGHFVGLGNPWAGTPVASPVVSAQGWTPLSTEFLNLQNYTNLVNLPNLSSVRVAGATLQSWLTGPFAPQLLPVSSSPQPGVLNSILQNFGQGAPQMKMVLACGTQPAGFGSRVVSLIGGLLGSSSDGMIPLDSCQASTGVGNMFANVKPLLLMPYPISHTELECNPQVIADVGNAVRSSTSAPVLTLTNLTLSPSAVVGGNSVIGTVTLNTAAPVGGTTVTLQSSNGAVQVPTSVTVSSGLTSASFSVSTAVVTVQTTVTVTAALEGVTEIAALTVNPPPPAQYNLTLGTSGAGSGTISASSSASGLNCGANCLSFAAGSVVTLTATPNSGSTFIGWSGACSGTGTCTLTMDASKTVIAIFNLASGGAGVPLGTWSGKDTWSYAFSSIGCPNDITVTFNDTLTLTSVDASGNLPGTLTQTVTSVVGTPCLIPGYHVGDGPFTSSVYVSISGTTVSFSYDDNIQIPLTLSGTTMSGSGTFGNCSPVGGTCSETVALTKQ